MSCEKSLLDKVLGMNDRILNNLAKCGVLIDRIPVYLIFQDSEDSDEDIDDPGHTFGKKRALVPPPTVIVASKVMNRGSSQEIEGDAIVEEISGSYTEDYLKSADYWEIKSERYFIADGGLIKSKDNLTYKAIMKRVPVAANTDGFREAMDSHTPDEDF